MEVIGLVAGIVQLVEGSFKAYRLIEGMKSADKDHQHLSQEILQLWMALRGLEAKCPKLEGHQDEDWAQPILSLARDGILKDIRSALDELDLKLKTTTKRKGNVWQTLIWPLKKEEAEKIINRIYRLQTHITTATNESQQIMTKTMLRSSEHDRFMKIMNWLSPLNFRQKQQAITGCPKTGGWFLKSREFEEWESGREPTLLCHGIPGSGKTVLASMAFGELLRRHEKAENNTTAILIIYCQSENSNGQSLDSLLANLLKQVYQIGGNYPEDLEKLYSQHTKKDTRLTLSEIQNLANESMVKYKTRYIIVDGIDELDDAVRMPLLEILHSLKGGVNLMVTSRDVTSITSHFGGPFAVVFCDSCGKSELGSYQHCEYCDDFDLCKTCFEGQKKCPVPQHTYITRFNSESIKIAANTKDLRSFIQWRIDCSESLQRFTVRDSTLQEKIEKRIVLIAKGMFLMATFHMDSLGQALNEAQLMDVLENLPKSIDNTFDQAYARIERLPEGHQKALKQLMQLVTYAKRPLTLKEFREVTAIDAVARELDLRRSFNAQFLTSFSAGMLVIDEADRIRPVHLTAEGWLRRNRSKLFPDGDKELAQSCLEYLQLRVFDQGAFTGTNELTIGTMINKRFQNHCFLNYAVVYWGDHVRNSNEDAAVTTLALKLLRSKQHTEAATQARWSADNSWHAKKSVNSLHLAASFGLTRIVHILLKDGADINCLDALNMTPLIYASERGHTDTVDALLKAGAYPDRSCKRGITALQGAVRQGHKDTVTRLLAENTFSLDAMDVSEYNYTALMIASAKDLHDIAHIILERPDVDPNVRESQSGQTALMVAAVEGSLDTAKVLLGHRLIDVNIQAEYGSTALHYAAKNNFPEIVDALLAAGANPDLCDLRGGTALQRAIDENVISVVQKMINWNVKLDTTDRFDRNLLHSAAINGRYTILEMLLRTSNVPDINAQGSNGETPLHDAAKMGYVKSAKVLLDHGARTDILDKSGKTPVRYAKDMKRVKILELLRKAREEEQEPITRGIGHSDTFTKNVDMPLYVAVQTETLELIKKKIQTASSAELNQRGTDWGQTPLHYACSYTRPDVMALLLDAKADINARDNLERTALHIACQNNSASALECVQVLVNYGADLDLIWEGVTASQFALNVGNGGVAAALIGEGSSLKFTTTESQDVLAWAAAIGNRKAVERLLAAGASPHLKDRTGKTPIQWALEWEHKEIALLLTSYSLKEPVFPKKKILPDFEVISGEREVKAEEEEQLKPELLSDRKEPLDSELPTSVDGYKQPSAPAMGLKIPLDPRMWKLEGLSEIQLPLHVVLSMFLVALLIVFQLYH